MPRRRYYRRYTRVAAPRKKWATNMKVGAFAATISGATGQGISPLVVNSIQASTPTPVIVKTGNFKVQGDCLISATSGNIFSGTMIMLYVMYLPEAVINASETNYIQMIDAHPEWIMAWKVIDTGVASSSANLSNTSGFSFSSRLKRNLNSGDSVVLIAVVREAGVTAALNVRINYSCQYWTCAN